MRTLLPHVRRIPLDLVLACALALASACARSSSSGAADPHGLPLAAPPVPGDEVQKPSGGTFFFDPNASGTRPALHLAELFWGRLVDVYDQDASGVVSPDPCFRDLVVSENIQTDATNYTLVEGTVDQRARVIIHAKKGSPFFTDLLRHAMSGLPAIAPKPETAAPPFSFVARNTCVVARFDDCLRDDASAAQSLVETVRLVTGYPPRAPFAARIFFDPNHGGLVNGDFHSTRVLIDLTVSEREAATSPVPLPINAIGLPASLENLDTANATLRIPTQKDLGAGQFVLLRNWTGHALDPAANGPVDLTSPTKDVVRAVRAGNGTDTNAGFMLDLTPPRVLGDLPLLVESAFPVADRVLGVRCSFTSSCRIVPAAGDVLSAGGFLLEVLAPVAPPQSHFKLRVRALDPIPQPAVLLGLGALVVAFDNPRTQSLDSACWASFSPPPPAPGNGVSTSARVRLHFSEPMDASTMLARDDFLVVRGASPTAPTATNTVIGDVLASASAQEFTFVPTLPFAHLQGVDEPLHVRLGEPRDLAGNRIDVFDGGPRFVDFRLDPQESAQANGGILLRFAEFDELAPLGFPDLRGQYFIDLDRGEIRPRPVSSTSWPVDRTNPVPSIMIPFPRGVQVPLNPLGAKLHSVWRYCDVGWSARDETKYNLDVAGLSWAPVGGTVIADFFAGFEIRLGHSRFLPDEAIDLNLLPRWQNSGLVGNPHPFTDNLLVDPLGPQKIVHPKALGYRIRASDLFVASSGTIMLPYPLNRGTASLSTYTWRDTSLVAKAGPNGAGVPTDIEAGPPLFLENQPGTLASAGNVPSFGLPLLMEFRCYPSDTALGLNALDVSLALNSSPMPAFRAFSSGGFNTLGNAVAVDPDHEDVPLGTFNPNSTPPGLRTPPIDNVVFIGQLDTVTRVSRVHSIWIDSGVPNPGYFTPSAAPAPDAQPAGTAVQLAFRGATGFTPGTSSAPFDASRIDAYGEVANVTPTFAGGGLWTSDVGTLSGARYVQLRLSFVNDVASGASPRLTALGIPFLVR